jgi:hypothetical protein
MAITTASQDAWRQAPPTVQRTGPSKACPTTILAPYGRAANVDGLVSPHGFSGLLCLSPSLDLRVVAPLGPALSSWHLRCYGVASSRPSIRGLACRQNVHDSFVVLTVRSRRETGFVAGKETIHLDAWRRVRRTRRGQVKRFHPNVVRRLYHFGRSVSDLARACRLMGEGAYDRLHAETIVRAVKEKTAVE